VSGFRPEASKFRSCNLCGSGEPAHLEYEIDGFHIVRCSRCDLIYVAEELRSEEVAAYYSEAYYTGAQNKGYADYIGRRELRKAYFRSAMPMIKRYLAAKVPRVLDVGCATGFFLEVAHEQGWEARGVEVSAYAAEYARSRLGLDVLTGTLAEVKQPACTFDLITFWDVIEHVRDPLETLTLAYDLLRPEGLAIISTGDISGLTARFYGRRWALLAPPGHLFYFSRKTLFSMLRRAGFRSLDWQSDGAFLVNDVPEGTMHSGDCFLLNSVARFQQNRWVNALLRRLKCGNVITVYARKCGPR
jgi:2-polyprenyl-3-methyl-5-hydroxy-6-metoxy-1,4-benzoquinol methylase